MNLDLKVTSVFERNFNATAKIVCNIGGARSSKSYSMAQLFVVLLVTGKKKRMLVTRKHLPALRQTAYAQVIDLLKEYGIYDERAHNKTDRTYRYKDNFILFTSIDDPEKMKSASWTDVWMEEATQFDYEDFMSLWLRMSDVQEDGSRNRIYLTYNPGDRTGWIAEKMEKHKDAEIIHSTYLDNGFLDEDFVETLTDLEHTDPELYAIYTKGEYATLGSIIFPNWSSIDLMPSEFTAEVFGIDFGFNNPTAVVRARFGKSAINLRQELYKRGMTNGELIDFLRTIDGLTKQPIYCDAAEPDRIEEICRAGFNAHPADKSVKNGIDFMKRRRIYVTTDSTDLTKEIGTYKWLLDKNGKPLDEPVKFNDHALDASRYAVYSHGKRYGDKLFGEGRKPIKDATPRERRKRTRSSQFDAY